MAQQHLYPWQRPHPWQRITGPRTPESLLIMRSDRERLDRVLLSLTPYELNTLRAVAQSGSQAAAAKVLGVSRTAVWATFQRASQKIRDRWPLPRFDRWP